MTTDLRQRVQEVLAGIDDPEMPISIVDLGIVEDVAVDRGTVTVSITPTFTGCPALDLIDTHIRTGLAALDGVDRVHVEHVFDPPWSTERISEAGRARLAAHGVTVPGSTLVQLGVPATEPVACPYCGSTRTRVDSPFGPTRCRAIHYCESCHNPFERMKALPPGG